MNDVGRGRIVFAVRALAVPVVVVLTAGFDPPRALAFLVGPATLFGLFSPAVGYRVYLWQREGGARIERAAGLSLAVTEAAAYLGILVHVFSGRLSPLAGVVTHVILAAAIWGQR